MSDLIDGAKALAELGALGLCYYLVREQGKENKRHDDIIENHLHEDVTSREKNTAVLTKLCDLIDVLIKRK